LHCNQRIPYLKKERKGRAALQDKHEVAKSCRLLSKLRVKKRFRETDWKFFNLFPRKLVFLHS
jgi:hypothetical protein